MGRKGLPMAEVRTFKLTEVLAVTSGMLFYGGDEGGVDSLYAILDFMTGDSLYIHMLGHASDECKPYILDKYPELASFKADKSRFTTRISRDEYVADLVKQYGNDFELSPIPKDDHKVLDPIESLQAMTNKPIITIDEDGNVDEYLHGGN